MKALVYHGPASGLGHRRPIRTIEEPTDASSGSTPRRSAAPTCTSSRATCPRPRRARSSATRRSAPSQGRPGGDAPCAAGDRVLRVVHQRVRALPLLQGGPLRPVPRRRRWILGHTIDGLQAEYARVPFADNSVYKVPDGSATSRSCSSPTSFPTAFEVGVLNGMVHPGDVVAIVGAGPIGLAAIMTAQAVHAGADHRDRPGRQPARARAGVRRRRRRSTTARGRLARVMELTGASAPTSPSRRWACRRRSSWHASSSAPAAASPTSASTGARRRCTSRALDPRRDGDDRAGRHLARSRS